MPYEVTLTLKDRFAKKPYRKTFICRSSVATFAAADAAADALITAFGNVSDMAVTAKRVSFLTEYANTTATGEASEKAVIVANLSTTGKTANHEIPSPVDGIFTTSDLTFIDASDAALLAYMELFTLTDGDFEISDGEFVADTELVKSGARYGKSISF